MKNNKIDEIKQLIPDYITGFLSEEESKRVRSAIERSNELRAMYTDMKSAFELAESAEFDEPAAQYWNNLLPRIHSKLEERNKYTYARNPLSYIWKILLPAAAVILIFVILRISNNQEPQLAQKGDNIIEPKITEEKEIETIREEKTEFTDTKNIIKHRNKSLRNILTPDRANNNIDNISEPGFQLKEETENDNFASLDIEELSVFGTGASGILDDDINNELENLTDSEREAFLEELKSNL